MKNNYQSMSFWAGVLLACFIWFATSFFDYLWVNPNLSLWHHLMPLSNPYSILNRLMTAGAFILGGTICGITLNRLSKQQQKHLESTEKYKVTLESIGDAVIASDVVGNVVHLNRIAEELTGWTVREAIGKPLVEVFRIINANTRLPVDNPVKKVLDTGEIVGLANHTILISREGLEYQIADSASPIKRETGEIIGVVMVFRNVTEEYRIQELLRTSEERFRTMAENIPGVIFRCTPDNDFTMLYLSKGINKLGGYSPEDLIQNKIRSFLSIIHTDDKLTLRNALEAATQDSGQIEEELRIIHADGTTRWIQMNARAILSKDNSIEYIDGVLTDITEMKRAKAALEKRMYALTRPVDAQSDISFDELFNLKDIQKLQDQFAKATGVASILTHPDGSPITKPSSFTRLCNDIIRGCKLGLKNCQKSDAELGKIKLDGPTIQTCKSGGLWDAGAGIGVDGYHIANWLIGQVRDETQSEEKIRSYAREIGAHEEQVAEAFKEIPAMSQQQFKNVADVLYTMANMLSDTAYQNVQQSRFINEKKQAEEALINSEESLRTTLNSIGDAVICCDLNRLITRINPVAQAMTGWSLEDAINKDISEILSIAEPENHIPIMDSIFKELHTRKNTVFNEHAILSSKNENKYHISGSIAPIQNDKGEITGSVLIFRDITETLVLQEKVKQSQKLDAIGQLAGGVAHDFNNMLGGITGGTELLKKFIPNDEKARKYLHMILDSADKAAALTTKLLTFSRQQPTRFGSIDIHEIIQDTVDILSQTLDRRIQIFIEPDAEIATINGDISQIQSVFLNLGINASHAMQYGGTLSFHTRNLELSETQCKASVSGLTPGSYIEIQVKDTGCGIPQEYLSRIFEPFFTTKERGRGTGLGLSEAHGTVVSHRGAISVYSEPEKGTAFHILLPLSKDVASDLTSELKAIHGKGCILLVDDEQVMRTCGEVILSDYGYSILLAENGKHALEVLKEKEQKIDLVILDMIMPEMNGRDCFFHIKEDYPHIPVILASGFTRNDDLQELRQCGLAGFIQKPFRGVELSHIVYEAIQKK